MILCVNAPFDEDDPYWDEYPSENNDFNHYEETIEDYNERQYDNYYNDTEDEEN